MAMRERFKVDGQKLKKLIPAILRGGYELKKEHFKKWLNSLLHWHKAGEKEYMIDEII